MAWAMASWLAAWTNLPGIAITITFVFQLFPDGRPPSRRWRPVVWLRPTRQDIRS